MKILTEIPGANGIGCEIHGLTFEALDDPKVRDELMRTWIEHGVIVFRGVEGPEFQLKLSGVFGDVQAHPKDSGAPRKYKEIVPISYNPQDADIVEINGVRLGGWLPWHMDLIYLDKVSRGSILRPVVLPSEGGRTGFIDKIQIYNKLSPELKAKIENLDVVYHFDIEMDNLKFARPESLKVISRSKLFQGIKAKCAEFPRVQHPLVYRQRETGRPVLNFSPYFAQFIPGLSTAESDEILFALGDLCLDPKNSYFHQWAMGDMVLWDNWRMLHAAGGVPENATRLMERTQIMGDYGLGRLESSDSTIRDEMRVTV